MPPHRNPNKPVPSHFQPAQEEAWERATTRNSPKQNNEEENTAKPFDWQQVWNRGLAGSQEQAKCEGEEEVAKLLADRQHVWNEAMPWSKDTERACTEGKTARKEEEPEEEADEEDVAKPLVDWRRALNAAMLKLTGPVWEISHDGEESGRAEAKGVDRKEGSDDGGGGEARDDDEQPELAPHPHICAVLDSLLGPGGSRTEAETEQQRTVVEGIGGERYDVHALRATAETAQRIGPGRRGLGGCQRRRRE